MLALPPQVQTALKKLNKAGFEAYVVGGGVRDALMGQPPKDYDITTSALPEQTKAVFADDRLIETGLKHGTVTVLSDGMPLEITTFRTDGAYTDFRHPDSVAFSRRLEDDLARRDFTVNALAYHPDCGIVDCFGGTDDLKNGILRCVGSPVSRFREDALRIFRALRFASVLGFAIEENTAAAIHSEKNLLSYVSAERICSEFFALLCGKAVRPVLEGYADVLGVILPQVKAMDGCLQNCRWHCYDVLRHTARAVEVIRPEPILRLSAFFHDIGKPLCRTTDEDGTDHFFGHAARSAEITEQCLIALRADTKTVQTVTELVRNHDMPVEMPVEEAEKSVKRVLNRLSAERFFQLLELKRADTLAHAPCCHGRLTSIDRAERLANAVLQKQECFSVRQLAVNGNDLLRMGIPQGKMIGAILQVLLEAVLDGTAENEPQALLRCAAEQYAKLCNK